MCGIIGVWNFRSGKPVDRGALSAARDLMSHRGPDAAGEWLDQDIGLGHRRLSILDLSDAGRQPMRDRTGRYVISYNGEIYNYRELREQYLSSTAFDSATDTEVYLNLFAKLGRKAIELCNGMFAIAIWDRDQRKLYLTRDRVGIKPLYYTHTSDGIAFASEIKSLLALEGVDNSVDRARVIAYLNFGYIPGAETIFTNIRKVLPATTLVLSEDGIEEQRFWNLTYQQEQDRGLEAYSEEFGELFTSAIDLRLRSDVPLGIFLSGGLDSSAVVAQLS
ncbi:MAG: asparagine synthase (glutamine-hydrolyzing), partial [Pseudomonadota bacterium]